MKGLQECPRRFCGGRMWIVDDGLHVVRRCLLCSRGDEWTWTMYTPPPATFGRETRRPRNERVTPSLFKRLTRPTLLRDEPDYEDASRLDNAVDPHGGRRGRYLSWNLVGVDEERGCLALTLPPSLGRHSHRWLIEPGEDPGYENVQRAMEA